LIVIYDPTAANYVMNTLQAASLQDDLPNLGFQGRKVG
jgi:hypothetical protein